MNYRLLLFISLLILTVGIAGLFLLPTSSDETASNATETTESSQPVKQEQPEQIISVAVLNRDVAKDTILAAEDYTLSELTIKADSPLLEANLKPLFAENGDITSLQGFLVTENIKANSILSPKLLLSPNDDRFILATLDSAKEVAYHFCVDEKESYLLDTLRNGDAVSLYSQQQDTTRRDSYFLNKLVGDATILRIKKAEQPKPEDKEEKKEKNSCVGNIAIKVQTEQMKNLYALDKEARVVILPESVQQETINHRGVFIRPLRGN